MSSAPPEKMVDLDAVLDILAGGPWWREHEKADDIRQASKAGLLAMARALRSFPKRGEDARRPD